MKIEIIEFGFTAEQRIYLSTKAAQEFSQLLESPYRQYFEGMLQGMDEPSLYRKVNNLNCTQWMLQRHTGLVGGEFVNILEFCNNEVSRRLQSFAKRHFQQTKFYRHMVRLVPFWAVFFERLSPLLDEVVVVLDKIWGQFHGKHPEAVLTLVKGRLYWGEEIVLVVKDYFGRSITYSDLALFLKFYYDLNGDFAYDLSRNTASSFYTKASRKLKRAYADYQRLSQIETVMDYAQTKDSKLCLQEGIEVLGLSVRAYNMLKRAGVNTINDLTNFSASDLKEIKNIGIKSVEEIQECLNKFNIICSKKEEIAA